MTVIRGPNSEVRFTMAEMEALSKIRPTPYLDEADLEVYGWALPTEHGIPGIDKDVLYAYYHAWRVSMGLE